LNPLRRFGKPTGCQLQHAPTRERSYGFANNRKYSVLVSVDKIKKEKAKGTWNSPSPDYYQTVVLRVLHTCLVTRSNFGIKEESPYKPEFAALMRQAIPGAGG